MPLVFSELASVYPPKQVSSPAPRSPPPTASSSWSSATPTSPSAATALVGREILEDVALARNIKRAKYGIRFRYAPDALATRMYRTLPEMIEGWTKNLALLFPRRCCSRSGESSISSSSSALPAIALAFATNPARPKWQSLVPSSSSGYGLLSLLRPRRPLATSPPLISPSPCSESLCSSGSSSAARWHHQASRNPSAWKGRSYKTSR
jgi:hypothetical protein